MAQSFYRISEAVRNDLDQFKQEVEKYHAGDFTDRTFQALRVPRGIYEQRTDGTYMVRIRIPGGGIYPDQLRQIAHISREFGDGVVHITTRQDIQIHYVKAPDLNAVTDLLLDAGLTSKGGGGNTVRNVTACDLAGVCPDEVFDVTPYAVALTEYLVDQPDSFNLPRKFKIAFSGCASDCAFATVNDLGFIAKEKDGVKGFRVYAAGGMGAHSRTAELIEDFVPVEEIGYVAAAVKQLFFQHGDRKNRHRARLRFVIEKFGLEKFLSLYREELQKVKATAISLDVRPIVSTLPERTLVESTNGETDTDFLRWRRFNLLPQKREGYFAVVIAVPRGNINADGLGKLADIAERFGEGAFRTSQLQNLVLRWVPTEQVSALYRALKAVGFHAPADTSDVVSCPGADTCRLGICLSRNLATAIRERLSAHDKKVDIKINGCPNACGQHPIAQIGLQGEAKRGDGSLAPYYKVALGGRVEEGKTAFGEPVGEMPAKNVPAFIEAFLSQYDAASNGDFYEFLSNGGRQTAETLISEFSALPTLEENEDYYIDWGAEQRFSLAGRGAGECGAGMLALIEEDLKNAENALKKAARAEARTQPLLEGLLSATRALLVTRGVEAKAAWEVFHLFNTHFIQTGLVESRYLELFRIAVEAQAQLVDAVEEIKAFMAQIQQLYSVLDIGTLQFKTEQTVEGEKPSQVEATPRVLDLRGLHCVPNYTRIKLALERLAPGEKLVALIDEGEPVQNVPVSLRKDGHHIAGIEPQEGHYRLTVQRR